MASIATPSHMPSGLPNLHLGRGAFGGYEKNYAETRPGERCALTSVLALGVKRFVLESLASATAPPVLCRASNIIKHAQADQVIPGLMHPVLGDYHISDIEFSAAIDIDINKVGKDLSRSHFRPAQQHLYLLPPAQEWRHRSNAA